MITITLTFPSAAEAMEALSKIEGTALKTELSSTVSEKPAKRSSAKAANKEIVVQDAAQPSSGNPFDGMPAAQAQTQVAQPQVQVAQPQVQVAQPQVQQQANVPPAALPSDSRELIINKAKQFINHFTTEGGLSLEEVGNILFNHFYAVEKMNMMKITEIPDAKLPALFTALDGALLQAAQSLAATKKMQNSLM